MLDLLFDAILETINQEQTISSLIFLAILIYISRSALSISVCINV